jgi:hypothetical protein
LEIPPDVQAMVADHLGKPYMEDRYTHHRIGTGKPPLSGWDRIKRARQRDIGGRGIQKTSPADPQTVG